jgi:chemotaxis protein MotA
MNWSFLLGILSLGAFAFYGLTQGGGDRSLLNTHGAGVVIGGTFVAMILNSPWRTLISALGNVAALFLPMRLPGEEAIITELSRLARRAQTEGGLLALQGESPDFAGGFLNRAINVAIATGESNEARRILETEVRQLRVRRQEDANIMRTMGTLAPMFGLLGTLLGMVRVLETVSTPTKVGPAMALALSSAFVGIASANLVCVPLAGQIRLRAITETMLLEMIIEGVLDITAGKPSSLVEMHLASYAQRRRGSAARGTAEPT